MGLLDPEELPDTVPEIVKNALVAYADHVTMDECGFGIPAINAEKNWIKTRKQLIEHFGEY